jgi:hypothetical protein
MERIIGAIVIMAVIIFLALLTSGCTTTPPPNINIGGAEACPPSSLTINYFTDIDKATLGDGANINDDDSGLKDPSLGLGLTP